MILISLSFYLMYLELNQLRYLIPIEISSNCLIINKIFFPQHLGNYKYHLLFSALRMKLDVIGTYHLIYIQLISSPWRSLLYFLSNDTTFNAIFLFLGLCNPKFLLELHLRPHSYNPENLKNLIKLDFFISLEHKLHLPKYTLFY